MSCVSRPAAYIFKRNCYHFITFIYHDVYLRQNQLIEIYNGEDGGEVVLCWDALFHRVLRIWGYAADVNHNHDYKRNR